MSKLILTNEVSGLGSAGDVVEVKEGYARNYLIPQGLAVAWTNGWREAGHLYSGRKAGQGHCHRGGGKKPEGQARGCTNQGEHEGWSKWTTIWRSQDCRCS